jgi:sec-independent protein translocase protein TatA
MGRIEELVLIILLAVVLFGGKKFGELGKGLGEGIRNFRDVFKDNSTAPRNPPPPNSKEDPKQ